MTGLAEGSTQRTINATSSGTEETTFENRDGVPVAALTADHLAKGVQFYLGLKSNEEPRTLASLIEDENGFRLLAINMRRGGAFFGVKLRKSWDPPPQRNHLRRSRTRASSEGTA